MKIGPNKQEKERHVPHTGSSDCSGSGTEQQAGTSPGQHPVARGDIMIWPQQGRLKQTVTLSPASLLFSCDTNIHRRRLTHALVPRITQKAPLSGKNSCYASFFPLLFPITPLGVNCLAEWLNRPRASL